MAQNVNDIIKSLPASRRRKIKKRAARPIVGIPARNAKTPHDPSESTPKK
jgi:hypothetical protein